MGRKARALLSAFLDFLFFVVLPNVGLLKASEEFLQQASSLGVDIGSMVLTISVLGVILTILDVVGGFVKESSPIYLLTGLLVPTIWYYIAVYGLSIGRAENFRRTTLSMRTEQGEVSVYIDLRFILLVLAVGVILKILSRVLEFASARE